MTARVVAGVRLGFDDPRNNSWTHQPPTQDLRGSFGGMEGKDGAWVVHGRGSDSVGHNPSMSRVAEIFDTLEYGPAPEAAAPALEWLDSHQRSFSHWIDGAWNSPLDGEFFATKSPRDGQEIARIAQGSAEDIDRAVQAAQRAFPAWSGLSGAERARHLYALGRQIQKHARLLAVLESLDNGKPIRETRDLDIPLVSRHFLHHAGWAQLLETELPGFQPLGVCGQIIPWNFPLLMLAWKIAPALAAGNTVVLKPAEYTPLTALLFAEITARAGLPPGVVNIVTGDGRTGAALAGHPVIKKLAFTGSTEVGRILRRQTAGTGKKLSLELGGKSPFLVFDDADLDSAVEGLVDAIWLNQGQVCCAGSRLLVHEGVAETLLAKVRARMETLRVGDPLDKAVDVGAIVAPEQLERIAMLVDQGVAEGATRFQPEQACPTGGWFYPPTLLTDVAPAATVAQVEIFGPVLVAMTFRTPTEAIALANNTPYGLAASVWTENLSLAHDIAGKVKAGTVWINCTNAFDAAAGFGGYRESGYGREGGREGLFEYLAEPVLPARAPSGEPSPTPTSSHLDQTAKQFIGGRQVRPDGGNSLVVTTRGSGTAEIARGNRKDVRNAVEAARLALPAWSSQTAAYRAQILYYLAENMDAQRERLIAGIAATRDQGAQAEFEAAVRHVMAAAAYADKFDGAVHPAPFRGVVYTLNEPLGVVGIVAPPGLLGVATLASAAVAMGCTVVALVGPEHPLGATAWARVLEESDVPDGVVNLVTGLAEETVATLADHDDVDGIWSFGPVELVREIEERSVGNLKRTWCLAEEPNWAAMDLRVVLRQATQVKNIWTPAGE